MKKHLLALLALLAVLMGALQAMAAESPPPAPYQEPFVEPPAPSHQGEYFNDCASCDSADACCCNPHRWVAGFAFVLVQPYREDDLAFTRTVDDGLLSETTDTIFENDLELAPRVWLEYCRGNGLGGRATYWQFDHGSPERSGTPAETGFETITPPAFGVVDLSTSTPGDVYRAASDIDLDVLDLEGTKWTQFNCWELGTSGGLRYASLRQGYQGLLANADEAALASIDAARRFEGFGPTFAIEGRRPMGCLTFFSMARGSLLFGDASSGFTAQEGLLGGTVFTTRREFERNDVISVGEIQVGIEWRSYQCNGGWFFCRTALEGQVWQGAGSATSEEGDLGFFGLNVSLGMTL